jgi:dephospho-CoA kinase
MIKLIVGLTGTLCSGKETAKRILMERFSAYHVTLSDVIRGELEKKKGVFNRFTLQDLGNEMRRKYGTEILAKMAISYLPRDKQMIIVDGIRNPGEISYLKKNFGNKFVLLAVDSPQEVRWQRMQGRNKVTDPKSFEEFVEAEKRDLGEGEPAWGQHVRDCMQQADFTVMNDGSLEDFRNKIFEVFKGIEI